MTIPPAPIEGRKVVVLAADCTGSQPVLPPERCVAFKADSPDGLTQLGAEVPFDCRRYPEVPAVVAPTALVPLP
jgi:hypothetical protein